MAIPILFASRADDANGTRQEPDKWYSDMEDIETDVWPKAGCPNRPQCKVMTSNVISTSVDEGVQPRGRRSHPAERRSTSSDGAMGAPSSDHNDRERTPPGNDPDFTKFRISIDFPLTIGGHAQTKIENRPQKQYLIWDLRFRRIPGNVSGNSAESGIQMKYCF